MDNLPSAWQTWLTIRTVNSSLTAATTFRNMDTFSFYMKEVVKLHREGKATRQGDHLREVGSAASEFEDVFNSILRGTNYRFCMLRARCCLLLALSFRLYRCRGILALSIALNFSSIGGRQPSQSCDVKLLNAPQQCQ